MVHVRVNNANIEPVFFTYPAVKEIDDIVSNIVSKKHLNMILLQKMGLGIISGL